MGRRKAEIAEIGDNQVISDPEREDHYTAKWIELEQKKIALSEKQKELLHEAKDSHDILKGAIKKAAKTLLGGGEKYHAKKSINMVAEAIIERFNADPNGQFYMFDNVEPQEEAA